MTPEIANLHSALIRAKSVYESCRYAFDQAQQRCRHVWDHPEGKSDPIVRPGYKVEAFHAGSDSEPEYWVPENRTPRWVRTCTLCGKTEETTEFNTKTVSTPRF